MRILHISTRLILGGSQENTVLSCEGQAKMGHEVHLAFGPIHGPEGSLLERVERFRPPDPRAIQTHIVPHLVRQISPWSDWRCAGELRTLIRAIRPDIVHTHSSKAGILGRWAAWGERKHPARFRIGEAGQPAAGPLGVVHTVHGPPFHPYQSRNLNRIYIAAERAAAQRCHLIVTVADAMIDQYIGAGIGRRDQYQTVYSGMETERYLTPLPGQSRLEMRERLGLAPGDFVMGTVSRLAELKGHDDILDALGPDLQNNRAWKLLWVGDGWWRQRLTDKARALGLTVRELDRENTPPAAGRPRARPAPGAPAKTPANPPQVLLTGLVPPDAVPGYIRAMDLLVHPSYREGLPRTVPQALLCGVCPVAYNVDGAREACRDGQTGRLVPPADRRGLRAAIAALAANPKERAVMASRGRIECRERFSAEAMVEKLEGVYRRALELAAGGRG